jgi:hypothetical protein
MLMVAFAAICTIFQQTTTCTMIPSLIMHLYDYQSSVNNITMCWLMATFDLLGVCLAQLMVRWHETVLTFHTVQRSRDHVSDAKQRRPYDHDA